MNRFLNAILTLGLAVAALVAAFGCAEKTSLDGKNYYDGDQDAASGESKKDAYKPPILPSSQLQFPVETISFGESKTAALPGGQPFYGFILNALAGASLSVTIAAKDDVFDPVAVVYGPRTYQGSFGQAIAFADDLGASKSSTLSGVKLQYDGVYLILVASFDNKTGGEFKIGVGCNGQCGAPACALEPCGLFCPGGFLVDPAGCPVCKCQDAIQCECSSDSDCPAGFTCDVSSCKCAATLDPCAQCGWEYEPVCGANGKTYLNKCQAECSNAGDVITGECVGQPKGCSSDSECEADQKCENGYCVSPSDGCECNDDYNPVCGADGQTYINQCAAKCKKAIIAYAGPCAAQECMPVCKTRVDFNADPNKEIEGYFDGCTDAFLLPTGCQWCGWNASGEQGCMNCMAVCAGEGTNLEGYYDNCTGALIKYSDCGGNANCVCPPIYKPVCGADGVTYMNQCEADCKKASVSYSGACGASAGACKADAECPYGYFCAVDSTDALNSVCKPAKEIECKADSDCPPEFFCYAAQPQTSYMGSFCAPLNDLECVRTGCFKEICSTGEVNTSCGEYQNAFSCFNFALCQKQTNGSCAWTKTADYEICLQRLSEAAPCDASGACPPGQVCSAGICAAAECVCPSVGPKVCGDDCKTYENACKLSCAGVKPIHEGPCNPTEPVCGSL